MEEIDMGYTNMGKVEKLAAEGKFLKPRGKTVTTYSTALVLALHMAYESYDWPEAHTDPETGRRIPAAKPREEWTYRLYTGGWEKVATALGMWHVGGAEAAQAIGPDPAGELERMAAKNMKLAIKQLSAAARFLEAQGIIKCIQPASFSLHRNAAWQLQLGDDAENDRIERHNLKALKIQRERKRKPWQHVSE